MKKAKLDFSEVKNKKDIDNVIKKSLGLGRSYTGTLDSLYKCVKKLKDVTVDMVNPKVYNEKILEYYNIVLSIFYSCKKLGDDRRFYTKESFKFVFFVFIFYSFIGWLVENFVEIVINGWTYMPREFLRGPLCPIFGIGAFVLLILLGNHIYNDRLSVWSKIPTVFVGSTIITSIIEFLTSYYLEFTTGTWPWKGYATQLFNLGGRIALANSLGFGLISTIGLLFIQPKVEETMKDMKYNMIFDVTYFTLLLLFVLDIVFAILMPTGVRLDIVRTSWR